MGRLYLSAIDAGYDQARDRAIGPWCLMGSDLPDLAWSNFDFVEPFETPKAMAQAAFDCAVLIRCEIGRLASELNARHGINCGLPFWWTLLAPWLQHLVEASWWHWTVAEKFVQRHRHDAFTYDAMETSDDWTWNFTDTRDFIYRGLRSGEFVAWMISGFLRDLAPPQWERRLLSPLEASPRDTPIPQPPQNTNALKWIVRNLVRRLPVTNLHGISTSSLPLSLYVMLLPRRTGTANDFKAESASARPATFSSAYLKALERLIVQTMPRSLGPDFTDYACHAAKMHYHPGRLFVTAPTIFEDRYGFEVAHALDAGERVVRMQHGSEYGTAEVFNVGWMNEYVNAAFLTWGWTAQADMPGRFIPVPSPMLSRLRDRHRRRSSDILFVGTAAILLPFRLMSWQQPSRMFGYRLDKARFIEALAPAIRENLSYRPYHRGHTDLPDEDWLQRRVGPLRLHTGSLHPALLSCRLAVLDHAGTTLNIALAANVPTVCYCPHDLIAPCVDAQPYFDALKAVGIFHDGPESAAAHVNAVAGDVDAWWQSSKTQAARRRWAARYARTDRNWWMGWLQALARI